MKVCPELVLQCQSPDLYRRAHNALLAEINSVIPVEALSPLMNYAVKLTRAILLTLKVKAPAQLSNP